MRYVMTGHKGLIGRELKHVLSSELEHFCVEAVDLPDNINDMEDWKIKRVDTLFHLASFCKINKTIEDPTLAFENNVRGVHSVLEFCRKNKIPKIIYFSSSRVLSDEKNPYVASKVYGEELIKAYHECFGLHYIILRPTTVYGGVDKTKRLFKIWMDNAKKNKPLIICGDKKKNLEFTHVSDVVRAVLYSMDGWNEEYNIKGFKHNVLDVAEEIIKQTNSKSRIIFRHSEIAQPQSVDIRDNKLRKLGYKPHMDIKEGIADYLKNETKQT